MRTQTLFLAALLLPNPFFMIAADWRPVSDAELTQKTPRIDPAADAEAIFWDVRIEDRAYQTHISLALNHYIRIKVFTDRGKEKFATVELEQPNGRSISEIAGRTIKPDGAILELKNDAIFERDLAKTKGFKLRGRAFTLPSVEAGDIIEYRYKETRNDEMASHMRLYFQRDIPMWSVTYHLKPLNIPGFPYEMRTSAFNCKHPPFEREPNGFYATTLSDMPAFQEEPNMPPEHELRAWMLVYYEEDRKVDAEKYWKETGRDDFSSFKPRMNPNNDVKRAAAELVSGVTDPEQKLAVLENFCRTKIENLSITSSQMTAEQRAALKDNKSPGDTLERKKGWGTDINLLFAAMANATGFDARMARIPDRGENFFSPARQLTYFIRSFSVAVKVNESWTFFDPATPYLERGMLRWQEEGVSALVSDPKNGFFTPTQYSQPARSTRRRRGTFKLLDNGSLEGTVEYTYTGHAGRAQKNIYGELTPAQREEDWKSVLEGRLSTAEITDFEMQDVSDPLKPIVVRHKVTVPGYAIRTGKRILLQPAFFQRNLAARFTLSNRKWPLYFEYGWAEDDEVTIDLPDGWELDAPQRPTNSKLGEIGNYAVEVRKTVDGRKLVYKRLFDWGRENKLYLPAASYSQVKKVFDFVQEQDNYTISLKAAGDEK